MSKNEPITLDNYQRDFGTTEVSEYQYTIEYRAPGSKQWEPIASADQDPEWHGHMFHHEWMERALQIAIKRQAEWPEADYRVIEQHRTRVRHEPYHPAMIRALAERKSD